MQDCSISIVTTLEILQSCTKPSIYHSNWSAYPDKFQSILVGSIFIWKIKLMDTDYMFIWIIQLNQYPNKISFFFKSVIWHYSFNFWYINVTVNMKFLFMRQTFKENITANEATARISHDLPNQCGPAADHPTLAMTFRTSQGQNRPIQAHQVSSHWMRQDFGFIIWIHCG